jgi:hypothetical protein
MLCTAYAASLHLVAITRAAHYFSLDSRHSAVRSVERAGVKGWWLAWWAVLAAWPVSIYFLPLLIKRLNGSNVGAWTVWGGLIGSRMGVEGGGGLIGSRMGGEGGGGLIGSRMGVEGGGGVGVTLLLGALAAHNVLWTCSESLFAHMLTKTPVIESLTAPAEGAEC